MKRKCIFLLLAVILDILLIFQYINILNKIDSKNIGNTNFLAVNADNNLNPYKDIPRVALTFDDGPSAQYTPVLLDGLLERNVKATFFVVGESIDDNKDIIKRMYDEGHLIGNHTYHHVQLTQCATNNACLEINMTNQKIYEITGKIPEFIRPPFGSWSKELSCNIDMISVLWDVDPLDWKIQNTDYVTGEILSNVKDNDIILLHDIFKTSVDAALKVVDALQEQGYEFVTVDKILLD